MNIGFWLCMILAIPFFAIGMVFSAFSYKAVKALSKIYFFTKEEQALYDKEYTSHAKNLCFIWAAIMFVGAMLSYFISPYMAIPAFILWLILLFREILFGPH